MLNFFIHGLEEQKLVFYENLMDFNKRNLSNFRVPLVFFISLSTFFSSYHEKILQTVLNRVK